MVIDERHRCLGERMKDGLVNLKLHIIPPYCDLGPLDATGDRYSLGEVIALLVEKVTANLGDLIPSIERAGLVVCKRNNIIVTRSVNETIDSEKSQTYMEKLKVSCAERTYRHLRCRYPCC